MESASILQHLMPTMANEGSQEMRNVACTLRHGVGKIWRGFQCTHSLRLRVSRASTALSKHGAPLRLPDLCTIGQ